jgi:phage tail sheath protein FI
MPGVYTFSDRVSAEWFAPAGLNRGGLGGAIQAERKLSTTDRNTLYESKVNPIASFPGVGLTAFGQKTLQTQSSALDRVNVRRLLIALKRYISSVARTLIFEQNTITTRNNFISQVNPYLETVQQRQGLFAYKVVMDDSNNTPDVIDRNQLVGQIYIQPTKTVEYIYLTFNITPTGVEFQ